jgi:hypothetical protein
MDIALCIINHFHDKKTPVHPLLYAPFLDSVDPTVAPMDNDKHHME